MTGIFGVGKAQSPPPWDTSPASQADTFSTLYPAANPDPKTPPRFVLLMFLKYHYDKWGDLCMTNVVTKQILRAQYQKAVKDLVQDF